MKKALLLTAILSSSPLFSQSYPEETTIDGSNPGAEIAQSVYQKRQEAKKALAEYLEVIRTDSYFAGTKSSITDFDGKMQVIDRTAQAMTRRPGTPPPRQDLLNMFLGRISEDVRGRMKLRVEYNYYPDGTLKQEIWDIDVSGSLTVETGKAEADDKNHR